MLTQRLIFQAPRLLVQPTIASRNINKNSQRPVPEYKHYRLWSLPGMLVNVKDILAKQHTMYWHPGLNVGIDDRRSLFALRDGIMIITEEKFDPDWDFNMTDTIYTNNKGDRLVPTYMRYIHVLPKRPISEYKLIDVV